MASKKLTFEELVGVIRDNGYIKPWKAINEDYRDEQLARKVVKAIRSDGGTEAVMEIFTKLWHKIGIELSGMTRKEYFENPDAPLWERDDWKWDEDSEEWIPETEMPD